MKRRPTTTLMSCCALLLLLAISLGSAAASPPRGTVVQASGTTAYLPYTVKAEAPLGACGDPPSAATPPTYLIDAGADVSNIPSSVYGITTNGSGDFILGWQDDNATHRFCGSITAPGTFGYARAEGGNTRFRIINTSSGQVLQFDSAATQDRMSLSFYASGQPVTFDLLIDGVRQPTSIVFSSGGSLATTNVIPFRLVPSTPIQ